MGTKRETATQRTGDSACMMVLLQRLWVHRGHECADLQITAVAWMRAQKDVRLLKDILGYVAADKNIKRVFKQALLSNGARSPLALGRRDIRHPTWYKVMAAVQTQAQDDRLNVETFRESPETPTCISSPRAPRKGNSKFQYYSRELGLP